MVYLISPQYLKENYLIDNNVDDKLILSAIEDAQEVDIHQIIGTNLLDDLKNQINNSTLTPQNQSLLDNYIIPCLTRYTLYYLSYYLNNRVTARGLVEKRSDSSESKDGEDMVIFREEMRNLAEFYAQRLIRHIIANYSLYPQYFTVTTIDKLRGRLTSYSIGWVLGSSRCGIRGLNTDSGQFNCGNQ